LCRDADVSGLTQLRRLEVWEPGVDDGCTAVEGLSGLTALEDLSLEGSRGPSAQPSALAPLSALTRLAMWCVPPELGSLPVAARLRRLELQAFGVLQAAPGGGDGSGANGAAAAALAALARGAPLLERLRIRVTILGYQDEHGPFLLADYPTGGVALGAPLGPGVSWPSLTHLQVVPWAALLLAGCAFPRLSRFAASSKEERGGNGIVADGRLRTAIAALAAKARDHTSLWVNERELRFPGAAGVLAAAAAVPRLRHLSWTHMLRAAGGAPAAPAGDWAPFAAALESLALVGPLSAFGYAEPLAALTCLTHLFLAVTSVDAAGGAPVRAARALARLPRLVHLRVTFPQGSDWGCPTVAAELARCPALRLLEIDGRNGRLWKLERDPPGGPRPHVSHPPPAWLPFARALRTGGFGGTVCPAPDTYPPGDGIEI
jgi:hypothetical protein